MEIISALLNVNIFTSWKIVDGWTKGQKKQERLTQVDLFALGATSQ